jgi:hypothetical protein
VAAECLSGHAGGALELRGELDLDGELGAVSVVH